MKLYRISYRLLFAALLALLADSCMRNAIDLEVKENGCRSLGIKGGDYELLEDPCQSDMFRVSSFCAHNEDTNCIQYLRVEPVFYNEANEQILLNDVNRSYETPDFYLDESEISFEYFYRFSDQSTTAKKVNYAVLNYYVESQALDESNTLSLRIHFPCTKIDEDDYTVINPDSVINIRRWGSETFPVEVWDNAAEDGDLISLYLNGEVIAEKVELFHEHKRFDVSKSLLKDGENDLVVFALNQGSSGPNTVSMSVNGKEVDLGSFARGLKTGNAVRVDF